MPELPEVETTKNGIEPHIAGKKFTCLEVRQPLLRWPVDQTEIRRLLGGEVLDVLRRGKYILIRFSAGDIMIHLGMSGSLRVLTADQPVGKHDHVDLRFDDVLIRFADPRRFGSILFQDCDEAHKLIASLGPEPLSDDFSVESLVASCKGKRVAIKQLIMNSQVVVGVGNIYANEALFRSGIDPRRPAGKIAKQRLSRLVDEIKAVLAEAIQQGGTTLKDFINSEGKPGYFKQELQVYGRAGEACTGCNATLKEIRLGQRSTVFCTQCQR